MMKEKTKDWYEIENVDQIDSPALIIYQERLKENIVSIVDVVGDVSRLRPHVKTHKSDEITRMMMEAGVQKFKCATISEAEMLGNCGVKDVLLAYQPTLIKAQRWITLIHRYKKTAFSCLVDNLDTVSQLSDAAVKNGMVISVYLDLDVGMHRTGLRPDELTVNLYKAINRFPGINLKGLHAYDGHINHPDIKVRKEWWEKAFKPVFALKQILINRGHKCLTLIAGGSPTFAFLTGQDNVECSPGTFVFWDHGYLQSIPEQKFRPAALVISRIISMPGDNLICLDLGYKSIASEKELNNRVFFLNAPQLKMIGHSEEHLVAEVPEGHHWKIGDVLYGLPFHICPTVALYENAVLIRDKKMISTLKITARNR
ncbi:D-TA family PLP-dependent enzyme [Pedobacter heparinus]|uniref:D-TA family PLP-dependent enzyme n=1 Tax=Pedobacter heparinus TaxID=984 RepID=UPI0029306F48|nr:D-TA family PLP-dependent enzyme [Pedobacter heparinus]